VAQAAGPAARPAALRARGRVPALLGRRPLPRDELVRRLAPGGWGWGWQDGRLAFIASVANYLPSRGTGGWFTHRHEGRNRGGPGHYAGRELADATLVWLLRTFRAVGDAE